MSAVCFLLPSMLESGIVILQKAVTFQNMMQKQVDNLVSGTNLQTYLDMVPDNVDFTLDNAAINAIMNYCPGIFPNIGAINLTFFEGWKKYLDFLKGNPLGILSGYMKSLNAFMKPLPALIAKLQGYVTCMVGVCGLSVGDAASFNATISGLEANLNLSPGGESQILASGPANILNDYETRVDNIKAGMNTFK